MRYSAIVLLVGVLSSSLASAQEYGVSVGAHQTTATTDTADTSAEGVLNWNIGVNMAYELMPAFRFKTGAIYKERHVDFKNSVTDTKTGFNFAYIDVPANLQYNVNEMFGVFGGMVFAINVSDKVKVPTGTAATDPGAKSLVALANVGVNLMFDNMIGFDFYYERGLGSYADHAKNFSTFGGNFIFWF